MTMETGMSEASDDLIVNDPRTDFEAVVAE
jgi:hypothetical protein